MVKLGLNESQEDVVAQKSKNKHTLIANLNQNGPYSGTVAQVSKNRRVGSRRSSTSSLSDIGTVSSVGQEGLDETAQGPSGLGTGLPTSDLPKEAQPGVASQESQRASPEDRRVLDTDGERRIVLEMCHNAPLAGHFGYRRTLEKVRRHYI